MELVGIAVISEKKRNSRDRRIVRWMFEKRGIFHRGRALEREILIPRWANSRLTEPVLPESVSFPGIWESRRDAETNPTWGSNLIVRGNYDKKEEDCCNFSRPLILIGMRSIVDEYVLLSEDGLLLPII